MQRGTFLTATAAAFTRLTAPRAVRDHAAALFRCPRHHGHRHARPHRARQAHLQSHGCRGYLQKRSTRNLVSSLQALRRRLYRTRPRRAWRAAADGLTQRGTPRCRDHSARLWHELTLLPASLVSPPPAAGPGCRVPHRSPHRVRCRVRQGDLHPAERPRPHCDRRKTFLRLHPRRLAEA